MEKALEIVIFIAGTVAIVHIIIPGLLLIARG